MSVKAVGEWGKVPRTEAGRVGHPVVRIVMITRPTPRRAPTWSDPCLDAEYLVQFQVSDSSPAYATDDLMVSGKRVPDVPTEERWWTEVHAARRCWRCIIGGANRDGWDSAERRTQ